MRAVDDRERLISLPVFVDAHLQCMESEEVG